MPSVVLRISNLPPGAASRKHLPCSLASVSEISIQSALSLSEPLNEHLVWLWGLLKHERRKLKTLQADGATLTCICAAYRGQLVLLPSAAEFLHLTGASLVVNVGAA